jgi:hypothetical protein
VGVKPVLLIIFSIKLAVAFGYMREEATGTSEKSRNEDLPNLYSSANITVKDDTLERI